MDMERITHRLEQMRIEAIARQSRLEKRVAHREEALPADFSEQAIELQNDETMQQLLLNVRAELADIQTAMQRVKAGAYATCAACSKHIEPHRLAALPTTKVCASCAQTH